MTGRVRRWWLGVTPSRWPIRVRLTVLYGLSFAAAGAVLVTATYILVSRSLFSPDDGAVLSRALTTLPQLGDIQNLTDLGDTEWARSVREVILAYREEKLDELLRWSLIALAAALVLAAGLGWVLAGRALRPLRQVTETAQRVAERSLHERIGLTGPPDEVKELADTIDQMLERLDRSFGSQRRFVANASHELRTPLAVNRTLLEVALGEDDVSADLRRLAPSLLATNERSERLVEGLLTLAQSELEVTERTTVDLAEIAGAVVDQEREPATVRGVRFVLDVHSAPVRGNALLMERAVANVVQNAARYSGSGTARVTTHLNDGAAILSVENPGRVFQPYEAEALFEPFRRGEDRLNSERGVGLGLSIVRSVVLAHGGTAAATPRAGGGLVVRLELPATPG